MSNRKIISASIVIAFLFVFTCIIGAKACRWANNVSKQCEQNYIDAVKVLQGEK